MDRHDELPVSVYLKDGLILLHGDLIATDAACCCEPLGSCCVVCDCSMQTASACAAMCGVFDGTFTCAPFGSCCGGGCCYNDIPTCAGLGCSRPCCHNESEATCVANGGTYLGDGNFCTLCSCTVGIEHFGACCTGVGHHTCNVVLHSICTAEGGIWHGDNSPCCPSTCA